MNIKKKKVVYIDSLSMDPKFFMDYFTSHSNRAHHNTKHRGGYEKTAESFGVKRLFLTFNGETLISNTNSTLKQAFKGEKNYEFNVNMLSVVK